MRGHGGGWVRLATVALLLASGADAVEVRGSLGRVSAGGWVEGYAVGPLDPDGRYQGPEGIVALTLSGDLPRKARLFLDVRSTFGGPARHPDGIGVVNLSDAFQNVAPAVEFEEGYVEATLGSVDVRVGKQKFAWGKLDSFQPTDVLNPRRYTDPFVLTDEESKIGIPAVRASYFLPPLGGRLPQDVSATLVWIPVPVPSRFPLEEERWFPSSTSVPPMLTVRPRDFGVDLPDVVSRNSLTTENRRPPQQLDEGGVGLRLAGLWKRADWALYYYDGPETLPSFSVDTTVRAAWPKRFPACLGQPSGPGQRACRVDSSNVLRPTSGRIRLVGADAAIEWRGLTARIEGAWSSNRLVPGTVDALVGEDNLARSLGPPMRFVRLGARLAAGEQVPLDLGDLFAARDTVEWGVGVDRTWRGWTPVLQMTQTYVLDNAAPLLVSDVDTRFLGVVRKPFLAERVQTEVGVLQGVARGYTASVSRFTYNVTDRLRVRVGFVLIAGSKRSLVGQYHDNDEAFVQLRYSY